MPTNEQALKEHLLQTDVEYRDLARTHRELDRRLHELAQKSYLSEQEQIEEVTLKKRKLQLKDRMADILRRHREGSPAAAAHH